MLSPRSIKLLRDAKTERGRLALMSLAVVVSLSALGAMLGAWAILEREITRSYTSTRPAHATLELTEGVDELRRAVPMPRELEPVVQRME